MSMSAQEAGTISFEEDRRGYSQAQVDAFKDRVVKALRFYEAEMAKFKERADQANVRIRELEDAEEAVKRTFLAATRTKKEMLTEAESEAKSLVDAATREAGTLTAEAAGEASSLRKAAESESERILEDMRVRAAEAEAETSAERQRLESRLAQLRTAVRDLDNRLRVFAEGAMDEVSMTHDLIDLEASKLEDIPAFKQPELEDHAG